MPLELQLSSAADLPRALELQRLAFEPSPSNPVLFPGPFPADSAAKEAKELAARLQNNPTARWLKIVDSEIAGPDGMVAFAKWSVYDTTLPTRKVRTFGPGCNVEACEAVFVEMDERRERFMAGKHYVYLKLLVVDPKHQRRGAGEMLTKWGIEEARRLGLPAFVESSEAAHKLYKRCGFRDVDAFSVDLSKWGADVVHNQYLMLWEGDAPTA